MTGSTNTVSSMTIIPISDRTKLPSATASVGFRQTNQALRSLLMHPLGIGLASLLNEKELPSSAVPIDQKRLVYNTCTQRDGIFKAAVTNWNGERETDLTKQIMAQINVSKIRNDNVLNIEAERGIDGGKGRPDFIISKENGQNPKSIVMMIEFGIGHQWWWLKQHQILLYVKILLKQEENKIHAYAFDQPILLTIITVNKRNNQTEGGDVDVRYGMFLCTRKNDDDFRLALLWRKRSTSLKDASKQFGKILYAANVCAMLREDRALRKSYEYLGPNCCKFGDLVSRCRRMSQHTHPCINYSNAEPNRVLFYCFDG